MLQYILYKEDTNKYIGYSDTGKVIHVGKLENAYRFNTPNEARYIQKISWKGFLKSLCFRCILKIESA